MTLADYIAGMEDGLVKTLFTLLDKFMSLCTTVAEYYSTTLHEIIIDVLEWAKIPDYQTKVVDVLLEGPWAFIYNVTIGDLILGTALLFVIIFGIAKYFTDIVF